MARFQKQYDDAFTSEQKELLLKQGVRAVLKNEQKDKWTETLERDYGISKLKNKKSVTIKYLGYYKMIAVAASLMLLVYVGQSVIATQQSPESLAMSYLESESMLHPGLTKGISTTNQENRQAAIKAFDAGNYKEAVGQFGRISDPTIEDRFYKGLSLFYNKEYKKSIDTFESLSQMDSIYAQEINWYKSMAHVLSGEMEAAKKTLSLIAKEDWNYGKAITLLKSMD